MRSGPAAIRLVLLAAGISVLLVGCDAVFPKRSPGEKIWRDRCAACHGLDGRGNTPRYMGTPEADLMDNVWTHGGEPGAWEVVIREGVVGVMPSNPNLSTQDVKAVVQYLRELRGEAKHSR